MHRIYLAYSIVRTFQEMLTLFDIEFHRDDALSKVAQIFGCDYIDPKSFEVYSRENYPSFSFDRDLIIRIFLFEADLHGWIRSTFRLKGRSSL